MTQKDLILEYIKEKGSIVPAKEHGFPYKNGFLGAESSRRCRELRAKGVLRSEQDGKFERFYLMESFNVKEWNKQFYPKKEEVKSNQMSMF